MIYGVLLALAGDHARAFLPWPVVQTRTVKNRHGNVVEIAQIHVLGELDARDRGAAATADGSSYSEQEKDAIQMVLFTQMLNKLCSEAKITHSIFEDEG